MKIKLHIPKSSKCNKIERVADMLSQVEVWDYMQVWVFEMINYLRMCSHDEYSWNTAHLTIKPTNRLFAYSWFDSKITCLNIFLKELFPLQQPKWYLL